MGEPRLRACDGAGVSRRARHRRQDRRQRGLLDADLLALCRPRRQAPGQAERRRQARAAAVRHRSHRHRAGAERFHHGAERAEQRALETQAGADQREASERSLCRQGGAAQGLAERAERSRPQRRTTCARPRPRFEAAHNRLRILGRSEEQITAFQQTRQISAETPIYSPLGGTVVQRKVGPGQFISSRRQRSRLRHRRSLHGVADRLCARERSGGCARRPGHRLQGAGAARPQFQGAHRLRRRRRSIRRPAG